MNSWRYRVRHRLLEYKFSEIYTCFCLNNDRQVNEYMSNPVNKCKFEYLSRTTKDNYREYMNSLHEILVLVSYVCVCLYLCACVCVCECMCTCLCVYVCAFVSVCVCEHMYLCVRACMCKCMRACVRAYMCVYMHVRVCV